MKIKPVSVSVLVAAAFGAASLPALAQNRSANQSLDEPIVLPKIEAGRVSAQLNGKSTGQAAGSVVVNQGVETQRIGAVTTIRVNSELGTSYTLTNGQTGNKLRSRDHDEFRVPLWRIGQF
jgi:hypothetical protein